MICVSPPDLEVTVQTDAPARGSLTITTGAVVDRGGLVPFGQENCTRFNLTLRAKWVTERWENDSREVLKKLLPPCVEEPCEASPEETCG